MSQIPISRENCLAAPYHDDHHGLNPVTHTGLFVLYFHPLNASGDGRVFFGLRLAVTESEPLLPASPPEPTHDMV